MTTPVRLAILLALVVLGIFLWLQRERDEDVQLDKGKAQTSSESQDARRKKPESRPAPASQPAHDPISDDVAAMVGTTVVDGMVVDEVGQPVPEAYVALTLLPWEPGSGHREAHKKNDEQAIEVTTQTDTEGRFAFPKQKRPVEVWVDARDKESRRFGQLRMMAAAGLTELKVTIVSGRAVRGVIVDENDRPLAGVTVGALHTDLWEPKRPGELANGDTNALTDEEGRFELRGLQAGELFLRIVDEGWILDDHRAVFLGKDADKELSLRASRGLTIKGRVIDDQGAPIMEAQIVIKPEGGGWRENKYGGTTQTDEEGRFRVGGLASGRYTILASGGGRWASPLDDKPQTMQHVPFMIKKKGIIAGDGNVEIRVEKK